MMVSDIPKIRQSRREGRTDRMFKAVQSPAVSLLEVSTDRITFALHVPAASSSRCGRFSFSAVGLRSYRALGRGETYLQPDVGGTVTSLLCERVPYLCAGVPCLVTAKSRDGTPLTLSCRSSAQTDTSVFPDGTLTCTLLPDPGRDTCEIELNVHGRRELILRLAFSLSEEFGDETFHLDVARAECLHRAIAALPAPSQSRRKTSLSVALLVTLAAGVLRASETAAEGADGKDTRRFYARIFGQFTRFSDKPPLRMLKYWISDTCRRLSDLAETAQEKKDGDLLFAASRTLYRRMSRRFEKVTECAPEEPFLEAVGAGPAFAEAYASYDAFVRAADGVLSPASFDLAVSRILRSRPCLDLCTLLPAVRPMPSGILRPLLPAASVAASDGDVTRLSVKTDPMSADDTLEETQNILSFASFLRDGAIPEVPGTERHPLGAALERELRETDWSRFDMLVGSLGSAGQLSSNLRFRYYYAPVAALPRPLPKVRYVAVYQSKRSGGDAGIRYYGEVTEYRVVLRRDIPFPVRRNNPEEPYYLFDVPRWRKLRRPIPVREEGVYAPRFTHPFLFRHALESYELFHVTSERDFRLLMTLRALSGAAHISQGSHTDDSVTEIPLAGESVLSILGDRLTLRVGEDEPVSFTLSDFARRPLYHFESLRKALPKT